MSIPIVLVVGFLAGALIAWFAMYLRAQARHHALRAELESERATLSERLNGAQARVTEMSALIEEREASLETRHQEIAGLKTSQAELSERLAQERKAAQEKLALLNEAQAVLSDAFRALSADALKSNNQAFIELAKATLEKFQEGAKGDLEARRKAVDELVRPLRESLEKVDGKLGEIEKARIEAYSELNVQLKGLVETHLPMLRSETANLVKALRQPTVRGRWGEIQLKRVVEMAGMLDHCDFLEQENRTTEEGRFRPDLIVRLPGGKTIVVDAKAPVTAYLDAAESEDETIQKTRLADHARQVRTHMAALGRKAYWEQFEQTPEFVVLFLPGEMFFSAALQQDPGLIEFGVDEGVIPATPTTLISLLKAVAYGWRQEALAKNAQEVAELGRQLFERITTLAGHWTKLGDRLGGAVDAYNSATSTLESRVLVSARKLSLLKAAPEDAEIDIIEPLDRTPRLLQAAEVLPQAASDAE